MADDTRTDTQSHPDISTEHQREGDARDLGDTLVREQDDTPGGQPPEPVEDRPMVGSVTPEDYPNDQTDH